MENFEIIKPAITAKGFRTAVKDYTEESVIEELAANSYDEDASTVIVLLDQKNNHLYIIDDGNGFDDTSIKEVTTLGGGDKSSSPYSKGRRAYLGSYGYGLKSTLNISNKVLIKTASQTNIFSTEIDWSILDHALTHDFKGYKFWKDKKPTQSGTGTIIQLHLKNPTSKSHLDSFGEVLNHLPLDNGQFKCYYGHYEDCYEYVKPFLQTFNGLRKIADSLYKKKHLSFANDSLEFELSECETEVFKDKDDPSVEAKFYFTGMNGDKIRSLKEKLRGIYVRVHGRLLKHNFSEDKYVYGISKYQMFKQGLRVEFSINWLRDQISLSRDDIKFSNEKLEKDFKLIVARNIGKFIRPRLDIIQKKKAKQSDIKLKQRLELANKRAKNESGVKIKSLKDGFNFRPETDSELAILLSNPSIMARINKAYKLIDYNDQASFDCIIYDTSKREFVYTELEPTLMEFLQHKNRDSIQLIITYTLGKWRTGSKKKTTKGFLELIQHEKKAKGNYKLLEYSTENSKTPKLDYQVIVLDEIL